MGVEVFSFPGIPIPFFPMTELMDQEAIKDLIQGCNENLSRAFFDKNGCANFWKVSEFIVQYLKEKPTNDICRVYEDLCSSIKISTNYLTRDTIHYMISLVMTGVENDS